MRINMPANVNSKPLRCAIEHDIAAQRVISSRPRELIAVYRAAEKLILKDVST